MTSGELYHSSLKNMQIVMLDYFLCQLFFLDPIRARSCSHLPEHHATKYNNTSDTIVTLMVAPFHDLSRHYCYGNLRLTVVGFKRVTLWVWQSRFNKMLLLPFFHCCFLSWP